MSRNLAEHGYHLIRAPWVRSYKQHIKDSLLEAAIHVARKINPSVYCAAERQSGDLTTFISACHKAEANNELTRACYEFFPALPSIIALVNNQHIMETVLQAGLSFPFPGTLPLVRIDRPNQDHFLTPAHQDFWYSMLSDNSVVLWYTLDEIDREMGFLKVIPGSHKNGVVPFRVYHEGHEPYTPLRSFDDSDFVEVQTGVDEILIFHQMLLHKSGLNRSDKVRLSMQLRYNDLATARKPTSTFTAKLSRFVEERQNEYLRTSG